MPARYRVALCAGGLLLFIGALLDPPPTKGAATSRMRPSPPDSLTAAAVSFELRYASPAVSSPLAPTRDRWLARDKAKHVVFSGLWTLSTQYVLVSKADWRAPDALPASVASGAAVGLAKELYDASQPTGTVSGKDLVADAVGIGLAASLIAL